MTLVDVVLFVLYYRFKLTCHVIRSSFIWLCLQAVKMLPRNIFPNRRDVTSSSRCLMSFVDDIWLHITKTSIIIGKGTMHSCSIVKLKRTFNAFQCLDGSGSVSSAPSRMITHTRSSGCCTTRFQWNEDWQLCLYHFNQLTDEEKADNTLKMSDKYKATNDYVQSTRLSPDSFEAWTKSSWALLCNLP